MKRDEKDLLNLFRALPPEQQDTLFSFAEFLAARSGDAPLEWAEPEPIPRPTEEKVVHAIKRLRKTYPMLDHSKMLYEVSECMTQHVVQGKAAIEVIDQLEGMFRSRFEVLKK
ncbi:MAG: hypothetical protein A2Z01_12630 [Betaproteobacteria bacterium RBG_16_58_11]|nr:MAG: hypothetical protein A2Z01_12630 [Betaproteobacteria bacterium RBG_16_58_11]